MSLVAYDYSDESGNEENDELPKGEIPEKQPSSSKVPEISDEEDVVDTFQKSHISLNLPKSTLQKNVFFKENEIAPQYRPSEKEIKLKQELQVMKPGKKNGPVRFVVPSASSVNFLELKFKRLVN